MIAPVLTDRALNRALLARQMLLGRESHAVVDAVHRLAGMQGQAPLAPYVGLWSRLREFEPGALAQAQERRQLVRATLMRGTVHLVAAEDALEWRTLMEPAIRRGFAGGFKKRLTAEDEERAISLGRELLTEAPLTRVELRRRFRERWPQSDDDAMAYAVSYLLPTAQPTPRGVWGRAQNAVQLTLLDSWLGRPLHATPSIDATVLRYLRAFGPASVNDVQTWSGLTGLREVIERLSPRLRVFTSEHGEALHDLPDAPRPDAELPAAPRFLPEYDNVLFSHRDRRRIIDTTRSVPLPPGFGAREGTFLVDGHLRGAWRARAGVLRIEPYAPVDDATAMDLVAEGGRLADFLDAPEVELSE